MTVKNRLHIKANEDFKRDDRFGMFFQVTNKNKDYNEETRYRN